MSHSARFHRLFAAFLGLSLAVVPWGAAGADSIYLKNGRVIHTASASVEDERVVFLQYGHPVAMPMSEVDRIEENDLAGPDASAPREPAAPSRNAVTSSLSAPASSTGAPAPANPEETKEYWQDRVRAIDARKVSLDLELKQLRRVERAFLFSHRSTADTRRQIEAVEARIDANERAMPELRREARRKGIPPGWLRLPSGG